MAGQFVRRKNPTAHKNGKKLDTINNNQEGNTKSRINIPGLTGQKPSLLYEQVNKQPSGNKKKHI